MADRKVKKTNVPNPLKEAEVIANYEICLGFAINVGDEVHFIEDADNKEYRDTIIKNFLRIKVTPKDQSLWIDSRRHITWGTVEGVSYSNNYYIGPEIQVHGFWFPIFLVKMLNGVELDWAAYENRR